MSSPELSYSIETDETARKTVYSQPIVSSPKLSYISENSYTLDFSIIESTSEVVLLKDEISRLKKQIARATECGTAGTQTESFCNQKTEGFQTDTNIKTINASCQTPVTNCVNTS